MFIADRAARGVIGILLALTLAGFSFGNSEADQRKAFIAFLQDINNRPGGHVLVPNANDEKAFGSYLQHYAIILDFNKDLTVSMQDFMAQMIKFGFGPNPSPRTIEQMAAAPADLPTLKDILDKMEQGLETRLAKASADRAALKQPDDLKSVYDKTFDRLVAAPTLAFENYAKALDSGIDASVALATYINAHHAKLIVSGMQIQAKDQRTLDELTPLMKAYQDAGERVIASQRASERVMNGD